MPNLNPQGQTRTPAKPRGGYLPFRMRQVALASSPSPVSWAIPKDASGKPEWMLIVHKGKFGGAENKGTANEVIDDRGPFENDQPDQLAALLNSRAQRGMMLHLDPHHQSQGAEDKIGIIPALCYYDHFENRGGEVWGHVESWTPYGEANFGNVRYTSGVLLHDAQGRIRDVKSVGATNTPATFVPALFAAQNGDGPMTDLEMAIAEKLGLGTDASPEDVLAALDAALSASLAGQDDPTKAPGYKPPVDGKTTETVGMATLTVQLQTLKTDNAAKESRLALLEAERKKGLIDACLARHARKVVGPSIKEFRKLAELDLAAADAYAATLPDAVPGSDVTEGVSLAGTGAVDTEAVAMLCREKVRAANKDGRVLSFTQAMKLATVELASKSA